MSEYLENDPRARYWAALFDEFAMRATGILDERAFLTQLWPRITLRSRTAGNKRERSAFEENDLRQGATKRLNTGSRVRQRLCTTWSLPRTSCRFGFGDFRGFSVQPELLKISLF